MENDPNTTQFAKGDQASDKVGILDIRLCLPPDMT